MRTIGGLKPEPDWKSTLANCLLNFEEKSPAVLEALYRKLEGDGEREAAEAVKMFIPTAQPIQAETIPAVRAEEVKENWFESLLRKLKPTPKPQSELPPPPPVEMPPSVDGRRTGSRARASDRYVNPF
jgi:hypothetical protein